MNKNNQKAAFTKSVLQNTLMQMLNFQTYNQISVLSLCETAKVSRAAFYRNYKDKNDLMASLISRIIDQVMEIHGREISPELFSAVWLDKKALIRALSESNLFSLFNVMLTKKIRSMYPEGAVYDYSSAIMAWNTGAVLYVWAEHGFQDPKSIVSKAGYTAIAAVKKNMIEQNNRE